MHAADGRNDGATNLPRLYLLFAGHHDQDRRGSGDLIATWASKHDARQALRQVRMQIPNRDGWAELTAVDAGGKVKRLSWFGRDSRTGQSPAAWAVAGADRPFETTKRTPVRRRWLLGRRRAPLGGIRDGEARSLGPGGGSEGRRASRPTRVSLGERRSAKCPLSQKVIS